MTVENRWIGKRMLRREDDCLLRGEGRFTDDATPANCLFLHLVRSPQGPGVITGIDLCGALDMPGVVDILTAADLALERAATINAQLPGAALHPMCVLAGERVSAIGEPVAAVIATSPAAARDAAECVMIGIDEAGDPRERVAVRHHWQRGGWQQEGAGRAVSVTLDHALVAPMALEPRAALAEPRDGGLVMRMSTQTPQRSRDELCAMLGLDRSRLRVIARDVGGAFGGKASLMPEEVITAMAALKLGKPVKWTSLRSDEFLAATQGRGASLTATLQLAEDGTPLSLNAEMRFPLGHWMPYSALIPMRNAGRILPGPYAIDNVSVRGTGELTQGAAVNIYRGAGRPEAAMLMERLMDRAAQALGRDPLDYRLDHTSDCIDLPSGDRVCSADPRGLLEVLAERTGYAGLRKRQAERRDNGEAVGIGIGLYVEPCGQGFETAAIELADDGTMIARTGASAQGQGRETAMAQIVAEVLNCAPERVRVLHSDTGDVDEGNGALASRSTAIGGSAMWRAAGAFAAAARDLAGRMMNCPAHEVRLAPDGLESEHGASLSWQALAAAGEPLSATIRHEAEAEAWASGAVLAEVSIDRDTGRLSVERITWVDDAGRIINPVLVEGQLIGGLAQGLGATLMEAIVYENGQLLTGSLMDYAVPRADDMPPVDLVARPIASPANPLGAKGVGEAGCIGVPAALLNAVQDALLPFGAPDLALPLTACKLWHAMEKKT